MKNYRRYFLLAFALVIFCSLASVRTSAQSRTVINGLNAAAKCFDENEAKFVEAGKDTTLTGNDAVIYNIDQKMPLLDKLIGCADTAISIKGMPLKARRGLAARKKEYVEAKETFTFQGCVFKSLDTAEKSLTKMNVRLDAKDKSGALTEIQTARDAASRSKVCAEQGLASKTISADMKSGLRQNLTEADSLLEKITSLQKDMEKMPEK